MKKIEKIIENNSINVYLPENESEYKLIVRRNESVLNNIFFALGMHNEKNYQDILGYKMHYEPIFMNPKYYYDLNRIKFENKLLFNLYEKDKTIFNKFANLCEKKGNELMKLSFEAKKNNAEKLSDNEIIKWLEKYFIKLQNYMVFIMMPISIEKYLEKSTEDSLRKLKLNESDFKKYYFAIVSPYKRNLSFLERESILKLSDLYQINSKNSKFIDELNEYLFNFNQIGVKYGVGKYWRKNDVIERIKLLIKDDVNAQLNKLYGIENENSDCIKDLKEKYDLKDEFMKTIDLVRKFVYLRTFRTDVISNSFANHFNLFDELAKRNNLSHEQFLKCFPHEILNKSYPSKKEIKKRETLIVKSQRDIIIYSSGKSASKIIKKLNIIFKEDKKVKIVRKIKGMIANQGNASGQVKIIRDNRDLKKILKNDILVTSMTTPDFVPAMEKASAFVTDEGGITCHAAIVSREFNKPCIIGTKIATKVLKDGDLVEVDANKGEVRIIKKSK